MFGYRMSRFLHILLKIKTKSDIIKIAAKTTLRILKLKPEFLMKLESNTVNLYD